jgi:ubiquinone/menaquinone biosynthesis C-methylase UbiE
MENKIAYFDAVAHRYFQRYQENSPGGYEARVRKQRVMELLDKSGCRVLDVGCGPGIMVQELFHLGYEFWGVDASPRMIEQCHKIFGHTKGVHLSVGDTTDLKFSDGFIDLVICMGVIDRIEKYELAIKEMMRVIKKDGTLIITFPNLYSPYAAWRAFVFYPIVNFLKPIYYSILRRPQTPSLLSSFVKLYTGRSATELVKRYSGEVTDVVYYNFNVFLSPLDEIFPRLSMWLTKRLEKYRSGKLRWLGSSFILKVKKVK